MCIAKNIPRTLNNKGIEACPISIIKTLNIHVCSQLFERHEYGNVRYHIPFSNENQSRLATQNKARY